MALHLTLTHNHWAQVRCPGGACGRELLPATRSLLGHYAASSAGLCQEASQQEELYGLKAGGQDCGRVWRELPSGRCASLEINPIPKGPSHPTSCIQSECEQSQPAVRTHSNLHSPRVAKGIIPTSVKMPDESGRAWLSDSHTATALGRGTPHREREEWGRRLPEWAGHHPGANQIDQSVPQPPDRILHHKSYKTSEGPARFVAISRNGEPSVAHVHSFSEGILTPIPSEEEL